MKVGGKHNMRDFGFFIFIDICFEIDFRKEVLLISF